MLDPGNTSINHPNSKEPTHSTQQPSVCHRPGNNVGLAGRDLSSAGAGSDSGIIELPITHRLSSRGPHRTYCGGLEKGPKCLGSIHNNRLFLKHDPQVEARRRALIPGKCTSLILTTAVVLDPQVSHAQAEDGQLVQTGANLLGEGQQLRQPLQLPVQPVPVALRRVGFNDVAAIRRLLSTQERRSFQFRFPFWGLLISSIRTTKGIFLMGGGSESFKMVGKLIVRLLFADPEKKKKKQF